MRHSSIHPHHCHRDSNSILVYVTRNVKLNNRGKQVRFYAGNGSTRTHIVSPCLSSVVVSIIHITARTNCLALRKKIFMKLNTTFIPGRASKFSTVFRNCNLQCTKIKIPQTFKILIIRFSNAKFTLAYRF